MFITNNFGTPYPNTLSKIISKHNSALYLENHTGLHRVDDTTSWHGLIFFCKTQSESRTHFTSTMVKRMPLTRAPPPAPPRLPPPPGTSSLRSTHPSWHAYAVPPHHDAAVPVDWLARAYDEGVRKELEDYAFASGRRAAAAAIQAQEIAARMRLAYAAGYGDGFHAVLPPRPVTMVPLNQRSVSALVGTSMHDDDDTDDDAKVYKERLLLPVTIDVNPYWLKEKLIRKF